MLVLLNVGLHVPLMPLSDITGSVRLVPEQIGLILLKLGMTIGFTFIVKVVIDAH